MSDRGSLHLRHLPPAAAFIDGPPLSVGEYSESFSKHDAGDNTSMHDLDQEAWLMLLSYPLDACSFKAIAKSICSFADLKHVHESNILARVVVKVVLHDRRRIPPEVVVTAGDPPRAKSWMVPVFVLSASNILELGDEDPLPAVGISHPLPPYAPRWIGPHGMPPLHGGWKVEDNGALSGAAAGFAASGGVGDDDMEMINPMEEPGEQGAEHVAMAPHLPVARKMNMDVDPNQDADAVPEPTMQVDAAK